MTSEESKCLKGIGIILLFCNHFFTWSEWLVEGNTFWGIDNIAFQRIMLFSRISNALFAFLTGYGMWFYLKNSDICDGLKKNIIKGINVLITYWIALFAVFVPLDYFAGSDISGKIVMKNLIPIFPDRIITFSWYIYFYLIVLMILPLMKPLLDKEYNVFVYFAYCFGIPITVNMAFRFISRHINAPIISSIVVLTLTYIPTVLFGYGFAKYKLFDRLTKNSITVVLLCFVFAVFTRYFLGSRSTFDCLILGFFVTFLLCILRRLHMLKMIFETLGKYSLEMWLISAIFFKENNISNYFQKILYFTKNPFFILLEGGIICFTIGVIISFLDRGILNIRKLILKQKE